MCKQNTATRGYFGGKSHSHWRLVKHSQQIRKRKAEIVLVSVLSKLLSLHKLSCPQIWNIEQEKDREYVGKILDDPGFYRFPTGPDFCDGRQSFPTNENSNLVRRGRRRWISLITNPLNCWAPVPLSQRNMASL